MAKKVTAQPKRKPVDAETAKTSPRLSRTHRPDEGSVADWQIGLRRQFGSEQDLRDLDEDLDQPPQLPYVRPYAKIGRNDPCPCGSGKKYKKCHLDADPVAGG